MTVFQTPEPIWVSLEFGIGDLRLVASDNTETVVEVGPTDPTKEGDVRISPGEGPEELATVGPLGPFGWSRFDRRRDPATRGLTCQRRRGLGLRAR